MKSESTRLFNQRRLITSVLKSGIEVLKIDTEGVQIIWYYVVLKVTLKTNL